MVDVWARRVRLGGCVASSSHIALRARRIGARRPGVKGVKLERGWRGILALLEVISSLEGESLYESERSETPFAIDWRAIGIKPKTTCYVVPV